MTGNPRKRPSRRLSKLYQWARGIRPRSSLSDPSALARKVEDAVAAFRRSFHSISNELGPLEQQSSKLIHECEQLIDLASGGTQGATLFQESMSVLDQPLAHVDHCLRDQEPLLDLINRCDRHSAELLECQIAMNQALAPLSHMVVFFKIEAAQLEPEHQTTFLTVAGEIQRLRELVDRTFSENVESLETARVTIAKVKEKVERDYTANAKRVTTKRNEIEKAIESLDNQLSNQVGNDGRLKRVSNNFAAQITTLVSGLQYEDIFSQRCEHVINSLREGPPPGAVNGWLRLLAGQLEAVAEDLGQAREQLNMGIKNTVTQASDLEDASVMLRDLDNMTASTDGMVELLLGTFAEITEIITANTHLAEISYEDLQPVSDVTENLSSIVIEVSLNIQLIALNAQVRSVQLGDGSGLEVLAARTAEISAELGGLGDRTAREITELRQTIRELLGVLKTSRESGQEHQTTLETSGAGVVDKLHQMRDRTLTTLEAVSQQSTVVREMTHEGGADFHGIDQAQKNLRNIATELRASAGKSLPSAAEASRLKAHAASYTMASERTVHAKVTGESMEDSPVEQGFTMFTEPCDNGQTASPVGDASPAAPEWATSDEALPAGNSEPDSTESTFTTADSPPPADYLETASNASPKKAPELQLGQNVDLF